MNKLIFLIVFFTSTMAFTDQIATTPDGKKVILHEDNTWEYKTSKTSTSSDDELVPSDDAVNEWKDLKTNEDSEKGKLVVWEIRIWDTTDGVGLYGGPVASINKGYHCKIILLGNGINKFKVDDIAIIKGKFMGVNNDGYIQLKVLKYKITGITDHN